MTKPSRRPPARQGAAVLGLVGILVSALLGGCSPAPEPKLNLNGIEYTQAEFKYGLNVNPDPSVKLADDVVLVPNGAQAVRSITGDGLTWTLDPKAPGVDGLQVGKVMFLTGRGVGRIVDVTSADAGSEVTIAPVDITEVITEGDFSGDDVALDESQMIVYDTGELPWSVIPLGPSGQPADDASPAPPGTPSSDPPASPSSVAAARLARYAVPGRDVGDEPVPLDEEEYQPGDVSQRDPPPDPSWGNAGPMDVGDFHLTPKCCKSGVGVSIEYDKDGTRVKGTLEVVGTLPRASWHLRISGGTLESAGLTLTGSAGIHYVFSAATKTGLVGNLHRYVQLPASLEWNQVIGGIPFAFGLTQSFIIRTAFSSKDNHLDAEGLWSFSGGLGFAYTSATGLQVTKPADVSTTRSMLTSMGGGGTGAEGIVLAHRLEARIGIGVTNFSVGPFVDLVSSVGASRGSDIGILICKGVNLNIATGAGISYRLPEIVVKIVNFVLKLFQAKPILSQGNIARVEIPVLNRSAVFPESKICR
ncbi:MAG TPA: hypothetical protein VIZ22_02055 [Candidatus Limnocylindrales bacterium]